MKKIIAFLFLSFLFQGFAFCQIDSSIVSIYPHFPSCQKLKASNLEFLKCTDDAFVSFLKGNIQYPSEALKNKKEGKVWINFSINNDGILHKAKITYKIGRPRPKVDSLLQKEALRVIYKIPKWNINESIISPMYPSFDVYIHFKAGQIFVEVKRNFGFIRPIEELKLEAEKYENNKVERRKKREEFFKNQEEMLALDSTYEMEKYFVAPPPYYPLFPWCQVQQLSFKERQECSDKEIIRYIYNYLKLPKRARKKNTQGIIVAQFIVDKRGSIKHIEIIQDIENGFGEEVQRVINSMNNMEPKWRGIPSRGKQVHTRFTVKIPISFKLQSSTQKK